MSRLSAGLRCSPSDLLPEAPAGPPAGVDDVREAALLELFRALPAVEQDVLLKVGHAMAEAGAKPASRRRSSR